MASWLALWVTVFAAAHVVALLVLLHRRLPLARCSSRFARARRDGDAEPGGDAEGQAAGLSEEEAPGSPRLLRLQRSKAPRRAVLAWWGVGCSYAGHAGARKHVLQDAMGLVREGEMVGMLGPSGSGKSTLLELLAGRHATGDVTGRVGLLSSLSSKGAGSRAVDTTWPNSPAAKDEPASGDEDDGNSDGAAAGEGAQPPCALPGQSQEVHATTSVPAAWGADEGPRPLVAAEPAFLSDVGAPGARQPAAAAAAGLGVGQPEGPGVGADDVSGLKWRAVRQHGRAVKRCSAFVPQDSVFPPVLTAAEVLQVHASLQGLDLGPVNGGGASGMQRLEGVVAAALRDVGLDSRAHVLVGGPLPGGLLLRGLSGGERRRLSVACGLLGSPRLLMLDEPTTGLDASSAAALMARLARLCRDQGVSVLCSLHQPRASIWACLDTVVVLSAGRPVYCGGRGGLVPSLERLGFSYEPLSSGAPPDWVLDVVNTGFAKPQEFFGRTMATSEDVASASDAAVADWAARHPHVVHAASAAPAPAHGGQRDDSTIARAAQQRQQRRARFSPAAAAHWWRQVRVLAWREGALAVRNPADLAGRLLVFCWAAIVVGAIFFNMPSDVNGFTSRSVLLFVEAIILFLLPFVYMSLAVADRRTLTLEVAARLYPPSAYYAAKLALLLVFSSFNSLVFAAVAYGMSGLAPAAGPLLAHLLLATLGYLVAQQVLYCAAILSPNQDVAFMVSIAWTAVNILLANYPLRLSEYTMRWVAPLRWVSALYLTFSGLLAAQFRSLPTFSCAGGLGARATALLPSFLPTVPPAQMRFVQGLLSAPGPGCELRPDVVLGYFAVPWPWWAYALLLLAYLGVLHAASFAAVLWTTSGRKAAAR